MNMKGRSLIGGGQSTVRFDDIADCISVRVEPGDTDLKIYVGLEHIDTESLALHRWGNPNDVKGTKLRVWKGDIIFGKRRAYQRKVAVAPFDCICSAHAMVLRAKAANIDQRFLPFFMLSDVFLERAIAISEGSLSPTIKWKTLARQEFVIPTREAQMRIVATLGEVNAYINAVEMHLETTRQIARSLLGQIGTT